MSADPFGTALTRARVLDTWRASAARFREDANSEADLRVGGYRDRWFVELAANASDAALASGRSGWLAVRIVADELRVANTGTPLDAEGVGALASLRASAKRDGSSVGHFGVGFAAVLALTGEPEVVSTTGSIRFSAARTRESVRELPGLGAELDRRGGEVPVLRLPWPSGGIVPEGFDTEVRLPLPADVDPASLLELATDQAGDLLLALPGLSRITVLGQEFTRHDAGSTVTVDTPGGAARWHRHRHDGELGEAELAGLPAELRGSSGFSVCWAVRLDGFGNPVASSDDVVHAPTPTGDRLSLPARLFVTAPLEPDRSGLLRGTASDAVLAAAAAAYSGLLTGLPPRSRAPLLPAPGFPRSDVDSVLRDGIASALTGSRWLPAAAGGDLTPGSARVLDGATGELTSLLAGVVEGITIAELSDPRYAAALAALGVSRIGWAGLADELAGVSRPPSWWRGLYDAVANAGADVDELGALPVPLTDGRTVPGPRGALLLSTSRGDLVTEAGVPGLRIVHPDAEHPLLRRLGARDAGATEVLDTGEVVDAVTRSVADAAAGLDVAPLAALVLELVAVTGVEGGTRPWLSALALPDTAGEVRRADELVLPDATLLEVLDRDVLGENAPLGVLNGAVSAAHDRVVLRAAGVLDGFSVLLDEDPIGPDHDLPGEAGWWAVCGSAVSPPARVHAVRDLDLVADHRWERALRLLAGEPATWRAVTEPGGYTAWWLARYALLGGAPPRAWRLPSATGIAGLYDAVPARDTPEHLLAAAGVRDSLHVSDAGDAADVLDRLAEPGREIAQAVMLRAHAALADAVGSGAVDPDDVTPPNFVRCLTGDVVSCEHVAVLDRPWVMGVLAGESLVAVGDCGAAGALADLLDVPVASEGAAGVPESGGEPIAWSELPAVLAACGLLGADVPDGAVTVHDSLVVLGTRVSWWVDGDAVHTEDVTEGMARALAWSLDRWSQRHLIAVLLDDPAVPALLG